MASERASAPDPPVDLPEGRLIRVPGLGELFVRDTGGNGPPVLLLHGWMFPSDLNWFRVYKPLADAGYRVLALDHRGHGRGLRADEPFTLTGCASDAAALLKELDLAPAIVVGYSMGGPIASLMARDHPEAVAALVLCATAREWKDPRMKALWSGMGLLRLLLGAFPHQSWRWGLRRAGFPDSPVTSWVAAELSRGSARDIAEAGREIGRFDSRTWIKHLGVPAAVVVTTRDSAVPPRKQYELAESLSAPTFEIACDHSGVTVKGEQFCAVLLEALASVAARAKRVAA
ncbi:MAG TPA: alpha/beta hydrolase [Thermoleophilaceae bacterium]